MKRMILILMANSALLLGGQCEDTFAEIDRLNKYNIKYSENSMWKEELEVRLKMQKLAVIASIECKGEDKIKAEKYLQELSRAVDSSKSKQSY